MGRRMEKATGSRCSRGGAECGSMADLRTYDSPSLIRSPSSIDRRSSLSFFPYLSFSPGLRLREEAISITVEWWQLPVSLPPSLSHCPSVGSSRRGRRLLRSLPSSTFLQSLRLEASSCLLGVSMLGRVLMDSTGVQIKHSSVLTENCPFGSSSSGESGTAKRSRSISVDRRNSDEIKAVDAATSKKARIGATNLSELERVVEKPALMNVPAEGKNLDIGISGVKKPDVSSLDCRSCSSEDEEGSIDYTCIDDIFFKESVRKKLQFLSYMVGMDCSNPVEVLSEVVRVLKQLNGGWWCNSNAKLN